MNTELYLCLEPLIYNNGSRKSTTVYFNCIIEGDHTSKDLSELEDFIQGKIMSEIMDYADIFSLSNYKVISKKKTKKKIGIEFAKSIEEIKFEEILESNESFTFSKENVEIKEDGNLEINYLPLNVKQKIDFKNLWEIIESNIIGKIQEGDEIEMTDEKGNVIFELCGGSYLNVGLADLSIYDSKKMNKSRSVMTHLEGLKGGLFVREDGSIDIGDTQRTFYFKIYLNHLLKASMRANKTLNDLLKTKLLKK